MLRVAFALLFGLVTATAQPITEAASELASRTSSLLPRHAIVSLDLQNLSELPAGESSNFRSLFEAELRKAGIEMTANASAEPHVRITVSDNARGLLLVAEVTSGDSRQIAMLPWNPPAAGEEQPRISLTKRILWMQPEPILDVLLLDSNTQMLVLSASRVASYRLSGSSWTPVATASLVLPRPIPRDPRGRIESTPDGFRAHLPGATCTGALQPDLKISCVAGNEGWVADRNLLQSSELRTPYYASAAGFFTMPDGSVVNRASQVVAGAENWGSDIAPIESACGAALIATSTATDRDSVRAYQNAYQSTTPVSDALPLPGPVTALWPSETRAEVTLVIRNAQTGEYEASRLGLACSQ